MWKVGERVMARRQPEIYWYSGTIRHSDDQRYYIIFDDGEDGFAASREMGGCRFDVGDRVEVYQAATANYLAARVAEAGTDPLRVRYMNQEEQLVPLVKVRVHPEQWKQAELTPEEAAPVTWSICDRVLACWHDLDWYPGIVLEALPDRLHVLFDSGTQAILPPVKVRPLKLTVGERVLCRRHGGRDYYTGKITAIDGEKIQVQYDDGGKETTSARLLRLRRDDWFRSRAEKLIQAGTRVLAQGFDLFWYPARVLGVEGKRLQVRFADGDQGLVTPDQIRPLDITVGSKVQCRRGGGPQYLPGEIVEQDVDSIRVAYDAGGEEWTSMRLVRVER